MKRLGFLALAAFVGCVVIANYAVSHWGTAPTFPGGPHTVTILGLTAPSAVLVVGVSFTLRDLAQQFVGKWWVAAGIVAGAALSAWLASPGLAVASCVGFGASEALDLAVYTPLADRGQWMAALTASNAVGAALDSLLFLWIAFGWSSLHAFFWPQFWLKALMTVPAVGNAAVSGANRTTPVGSGSWKPDAIAPGRTPLGGLRIAERLPRRWCLGSLR